MAKEFLGKNWVRWVSFKICWSCVRPENGSDLGAKNRKSLTRPQSFLLRKKWRHLVRKGSSFHIPELCTEICSFRGCQSIAKKTFSWSLFRFTLQRSPMDTIPLASPSTPASGTGSGGPGLLSHSSSINGHRWPLTPLTRLCFSLSIFHWINNRHSFETAFVQKVKKSNLVHCYSRRRFSEFEGRRFGF